MEEKDVRRPRSGSQEVPEEGKTGEMNPIVDDGNNEETDGEQVSRSHHIPDIPVIQATSAPATILSLPEEVMELIFKKFSIADLNSCNAVCKTFKTWQDSNIIWHKKFVEKGHDAEAIDYIQNTRLQLVGDDFNTHPLYQSPCPWKYTYIKMNILRDNWENNESQMHIFDIGFDFNLVLVPEIKINGDLLLIPNYVKDECYVYNTLDIPFFKAKIQCGLLNERISVHIHKNLIIIVQLLLLSVYKIDENGKINLLYRRVLIKKEDKVPDDPVVDDWYGEFRLAMGLIDICFSNNYLVCCVRRQEKITFYAWELTQGIQVHVQDGSQLRGGVVNPSINEQSDLELIPPAATHSDEILVRISYIYNHTYNVYNFLRPDYRRVLSLESYILDGIAFECSRIVVTPSFLRDNLLQVYDCSINAQPNTLITQRPVPSLSNYYDVKVKGDLIAYVYSSMLVVSKYNSLDVPLYHAILGSEDEIHEIHYMFSNWDYILVVYPQREKKHENTLIHLHDYRKNVMIDISQTELFLGGLIPINSPTKFFIYKYEPDEFIRQITMIRFW